MFMLSRTSILQEEADDIVCEMLKAGYMLCADNSLSDGWGGWGWVDKYIRDARKTRAGVLVLDTDLAYFESEPCCDEIYAAWENNIPLTKIDYGGALGDGKYLWIQFTNELFSSHARYERAMRKRWGTRYTDSWATMTLGGYWKPELQGNLVTYYCVVPSSESRLAVRSGADEQRF
eukprot:TRINITY_DN7615_c0_g1_i1.p1 TRINITY_DN7615_c0_g1~~TRINITY_DN7615_c0_g1_i1.p1  ORF type:complete len:176 (-),score=8.53 TRINITY_DN7615_c0_g1_i1:199-726(-)